MGGMMPQGELRFPSFGGMRKSQAKFGLDVPAPRAAPYLSMRKHGNSTDEPKSTWPFAHAIRTAMEDHRRPGKAKHL